MTFGQNEFDRNGYNSYGDECSKCETFNEKGDINYPRTLWHAILNGHEECLNYCLDEVTVNKNNLIKYAHKLNKKNIIDYLQKNYNKSSKEIDDLLKEDEMSSKEVDISWEYFKKYVYNSSDSSNSSDSDN